MRLYIIRHADPHYPTDTITPAGHLEAQALSDRLGTMKFDRIYSSPLGRALATMQYTADRLKMSHEVLPWTAELGGCDIELEPWGKMAGWDCPGEIIREQIADHDGEGIFRAMPKVVMDIFARVRRESDAFLATLGYERQGGRYRIVRGNREHIAIFCHGGFGLTWLAHLLEVPLPLMWSGFWIPPSSVTTVLFEERSTQWAIPRCIGFGDVSHLHEARLPVQPRGIKANFD